MKKILILVQNYKIGGLETNLKTTMTFLKNNGYELFLVTSKGARLEEVEHLLEKTLLIDSEALLNNEVELVSEIREFISSNQISGVILHPFSTYQLGAIACLLENIPYFVVVHGPININKNDLKSYLFNKYFTFPNAQKVFVVSKELSDILLNDYCVQSEIMHNPISLEKSLGVNVVPKDFVYLSRLDEDKLNGLKEVIKFVDVYNQKGNFKKLTIVGDGNKKHELVNWINENFNDSSWIELVGYRSNVQNYIENAQIVFGMGRVALEALILGKNIVLTGYDGLKGIITSGNIDNFIYANFSGRNLANVDYDVLYEEIKEVESKDFDRNLQKFVEEKFSVNVIENTLVKELNHLKDPTERSIFSEVLVIEELLNYFRDYLNNEGNVELFKYYLKNQDIKNVGNARDSLLLKQLLAEINESYKQLRLNILEKQNDNEWYRTEFDKNKATIADFQKKLEEKDKFISEFTAALENNTAVLKNLTNITSEKDQQIVELIQNQKEFVEKVADYEAKITYYNHVNYDLTHQLTSYQSTKAWRLLNKYYNFRTALRNLGAHSKKFSYILKTKGLKEAVGRSVMYLNSPKKEIVPNNSSQLIDLYLKVKSEFENGTIKGLIVIPSAFEFDELYNQRTINLAKYLSKEGFAVIYVAWQWGKDDKLEKNYQTFLGTIYQVPLFDFLETDFSLINSLDNKKFIITFPAKQFNDLIMNFRANSFDVIYDIMDEWEEFYHTGESPWYQKEVEEAIILNSDSIFAVSEPLKEKFAFLRKDIIVIGNGYDEKVSKVKNIALKDKAEDDKIHIGYFGHMTAAWFDWDLVFELADRSNVYIHLIGYGADDKTLNKMAGYENIKYYGKIHPGELHEYVKGWHIGMIPFKKSNLSVAVDPIKIYEYLYFGLPTVSTGIPHIGQYPMVTHCENAEDVYEAVMDIYSSTLDGTLENNEIEQFLESSTWENRFNTMLNEAKKADFYQSLFEGDSK